MVIALKRSNSNTYRIEEYLNDIEFSTIFKNHKINIVVNTVTNYGRKDIQISSIVDTNLD